MICKRFSAATLEDIAAMVGYGGVSCAQVINRLVDEYKKNNKPEEPAVPEVHEEPQTRKPQQTSSNGVIVKGESGMLVRFARCCSPVPGDNIVGYITRGRGVSGHRADCISLKDPEMEKARLIDVSWADRPENTTYDVEIRVLCYNRTGMFAEISVLLASNNVPVGSISGHNQKDNTYVFFMTITIKNTEQLDKVLRELKRLRDVIDASRVSQ